MSTSTNGFFHRPALSRGAFLGLVASAVLSFAQSGTAEPPAYASRGQYSVSLEDEYGTPLRTFRQNGTTFVLGYEGDRYNVRVENHGGRRVEAVVTIDGRDAVSGNVGDYVHARGYIVPAYGSVVITGFRQSLERAAAFRFSSPESSYSSRMGTPENVGVIGVAFFPERVYQPPPLVRAPEPRPTWPVRPYPYDRAAESAPRGAPAPQPSQAPAKSAPKAADAYGSASAGGAYREREARRDESPSRLGTEYGESTWSPVSEVSFERQDRSHPNTVLSLRYDDADGLTARGIDVYPHPYWPEQEYAAPNPFPANRFAPPPP
jgi:hypothetical protein